MIANDIMMSKYMMKVTLSGANARTAEADQQISQTGGDTETAHAIATESKAEAEKASVEAQRIVKESGETRKVAEQLKKSAEDMAEKLETTKSLVEEKEGAAETNSALANEALREANKAQSSSEDASKKVEQAKKELDDIMVLLLNIEDPGDYYSKITFTIFLIFRPGLTGRSVCSAGRGRAQILGGRPGGAPQGVGGGQAETGETDLVKTKYYIESHQHALFPVLT